MEAHKIGDRIGGRYIVHRIIGGMGKSGMGVVYICYDGKYNSVEIPAPVKATALVEFKSNSEA